MLLYSLWYGLFPDVIPLNGGFGFEGAYFYKAVVQDAYQTLVVRGLDAYSVQRILPFVLAHYLLRLLDLPLTDTVIIRYFMLYNGLLAGGIIYYRHLAESTADAFAGGHLGGLLGAAGELCHAQVRPLCPVYLRPYRPAGRADESVLPLGRATYALAVGGLGLVGRLAHSPVLQPAAAPDSALPAAACTG